MLSSQTDNRAVSSQTSEASNQVKRQIRGDNNTFIPPVVGHWGQLECAIASGPSHSMSLMFIDIVDKLTHRGNYI